MKRSEALNLYERNCGEKPEKFRTSAGFELDFISAVQYMIHFIIISFILILITIIIVRILIF